MADNSVQYQPWVVDLMKNISGLGKALGDIATPNASADTQKQADAMNQQTAQQQQSLQASMTDLDKIAAQIVGLKQKQQDLQKQMQTPAV
jgi:hypothetical protein